MKEFIAISNSTIYDVCLNTYGALDYLIKLLVDNNITDINTNPINGQKFLYDDTLVNKISNVNNSTNLIINSNLASIKYTTA
jgi:hypothetical protein